jgi:hypothetical protein
MPTPTTVLRDVRLDFFTDNTNTATNSAVLACGLVASTQNVLQLQGASGSAAVRLTGLASPTSATDAISAGYTSWKAPVRAATTTTLMGAAVYSNAGAGTITFTAQGPVSIDGVTLSENDRVLVKDESGGGASGAVVNGIYYASTIGVPLASSTVLTRAHDFAELLSVAGAVVTVSAGTVNANHVFVVSTNSPSVQVSMDQLVFEGIVGAGGGGGTPDDNSVGLVQLAHTAGGELIYYDGSGVPSHLAIGAAGRPLVSSGTVPQYALLDGTGLAAEIYKESLIIGNASGGETIQFGTDAADVIGMYVDGGLKLSATATGGAFSGTWSGSSDEKWKDLLGPISTDPLADLDKVDSQTWTWKPGFHFGNAGAFGAGVVAQQFQLVCPSAVTFSAEQDGLVVDYNAVHSFNLACIKALKAENASRQAENAALEARVVSLEQDNTDLKARLAALEAAFHAHTHP